MKMVSRLVLICIYYASSAVGQQVEEDALYYLQGEWQDGKAFIEKEMMKYSRGQSRRRLVLDDDATARTECSDLIEAYTECRNGDDDAAGGSNRRQLQDGDEENDDGDITTVNQALCKDLLFLQDTSQNPCHDGIYDDGDEGCEAELFSAYSCFFTVTCEEPFSCETFDSAKIFDHDDEQANPIADDYVGPTKYLTFYNSFPSADYLICFTYGPSFYNRHARTAGPLGYGEWLHAEFEGDILYFNIHTVSPTTNDCGDETRVSVTGRTLALAAHETPTNFIGWGADNFGIGSIDAYRTSAQSDLIEEKIFANEAIGYGRCSFTWTRPLPDGIVDPAAGAALPTDIGAIVRLDNYNGVQALEVSCDDESATLEIDASNFCNEAAQHFMAVGDSEKHFFPLQIMAIQGLPCNGLDLDEVQPPNIIGGIESQPDDDTSSSDSDQPNTSSSSSKKSSSNTALLMAVIALAVLCACCSICVIVLLVLLNKKRAYFAPNNHNNAIDVDPENSVIQLAPSSGPYKNPIPEHSTPESHNNEMI